MNKKPKETERLTICGVSKSVCKKCKGKGYYLVDEWFGSLQGRKDCNHQTVC